MFDYKWHLWAARFIVMEECNNNHIAIASAKCVIGKTAASRDVQEIKRVFGLAKRIDCYG
jgi:hypothetical protein